MHIIEWAKNFGTYLTLGGKILNSKIDWIKISLKYCDYFLIMQLMMLSATTFKSTIEVLIKIPTYYFIA